MTFLFGWLLFGFFGSLAAIVAFRRDGTTKKKGELYTALIGPLFGPVITVLLLLDLYRRQTKS